MKSEELGIRGRGGALSQKEGDARVGSLVVEGGSKGQSSSVLCQR